MRTISCSTSRVTRGLPGPRRAFGAIELTGDKLAAPGKDGVLPRDSRDLGKGLAAQAMTDLPEHSSLGVRELQSPIQPTLQDAVFRGQIFVPRQQLLIHRPGNVGKDVRPIHNGPLAPTVPEWRRH
jgi:hypothetical protein